MTTTRFFKNKNIPSYVIKFQIAPAEIEQVINAVPGVADVGVAGIKISEDSSHPMALVVKDEDSDVSEEEIIKAVNG